MRDGNETMKNKIIVITGVAGSGKTYLAKKLSLDLFIDKVISLDLLLPLMKMMSNKNNKYLFTNTHNAYQIDNLDAVSAYLKHSKAVQQMLWPYLDQIDDKIFILEGSQLTRDYLENLSAKFNVISFNIYTSKENLINNYNKKSIIRKSNWLSHIDILLQLQEYNKIMFDGRNYYNDNSSNFYNNIKTELIKFIND